jgi:hypothetical protein
MTEKKLPSNSQNPKTSINPWAALWKFKGFRLATIALGSLLIILLAGYVVLTRVVSQPNVSFPGIDHKHFLAQVYVDGKRMNFAEQNFQVAYDKGQCTGQLTQEPIHFHDGRDEIVHLHWQGITGGQFLKFYGLNLIGGFDTVLGYKINKFPAIEAVPIHNQAIKQPEQNDTYFVYTGEADNVQERNMNDFKNQPLLTFFGKENLNQEDGLDHSGEFLGKVIIYIQKEKPSNQQVMDAFKGFKETNLGSCEG